MIHYNDWYKANFTMVNIPKPESFIDLSILRRIAERGLKFAQEDTKYIDIFQHLIDEIERHEKYLKAEYNAINETASD